MLLIHNEILQPINSFIKQSVHLNFKFYRKRLLWHNYGNTRK
jgi:hypothetical protein